MNKKHLKSDIEILDKWDRIKILLESLNLDVYKNAKGNNSAGIRARRGLRLLKQEVSDFIRTTIEKEKNKKLIKD